MFFIYFLLSPSSEKRHQYKFPCFFNVQGRKTSSKGQLISKGLFGVIVLINKPTKIIKSVLLYLASKVSSNQKTLLYNYVE